MIKKKKLITEIKDTEIKIILYKIHKKFKIKIIIIKIVINNIISVNFNR